MVLKLTTESSMEDWKLAYPKVHDRLLAIEKMLVHYDRDEHPYVPYSVTVEIPE